MSKAPSTSSAMVILAVFLYLGIAPQISNACSECICFPGDNTCSDVPCGTNLTANCVRTEFTPACTGTYTIYTETRCAVGYACYKCQSCANIFKVSGGTEEFLRNGHTNNCGTGNCVSTLTPTVELSVGVTYAIYVCKVTCPSPGDLSCDTCPNECTAYACLSIGVISCTP